MLISIKNLVFDINEKVSLRVDGGELLEGRNVLICGPNGSDKSVFANIFGSCAHPAAGVVTFSRPGIQQGYGSLHRYDLNNPLKSDQEDQCPISLCVSVDSGRVCKFIGNR